MTRDAEKPQVCVAMNPARPNAEEAAETALAVLDAVTLILSSAADPAALKLLVTKVQAKGIAVLIADDYEAARALGADGVHLTWRPGPLETLAAARRTLGQNAIVGVDAGATRHDAMELGEAGADYIAFGLPAGNAADSDAVERRAELITWWSDLFELPVVALNSRSPEEALRLAEAGAEFVVVEIPDDLDPQRLEAWLESYRTTLGPGAKAA